MGSVDEETLWKHWMYLKNELHVDELLEKLVSTGVFTEAQRNEVLNVTPNTRQMKAERFLKVLIQSGEKGFDAFCEILRQNSDNRYKAVMTKLNIATVSREEAAGAASVGDNDPENLRPESSASAGSSMSFNSLPSHDGETGEKNTKKSARRAWRSDASMAGSEIARQNTASSYLPNNDLHSSIQENININTTQSTNDVPQGAAESMPLSIIERQHSNVDMKALEQELLRLAPTIADVFQRISQTASQVPVSEEDIKKVKEDNERLRKTNRTLIEKLNTFQQRIIRLQLENKNLREAGEGAKDAKDDLDQKAHELEVIEKRIEDQKHALEEKEKELKNQLLKIQEIETNMAKQKDKIQELHDLYDEGVEESCRQQEEIQQLQDEKAIQNEQIDQLEQKQRNSRERMKDLEERLEQLEKAGNRRGIGLRRANPRAASKRMLGLMSDYN